MKVSLSTGKDDRHRQDAADVLVCERLRMVEASVSWW